MACIPQLHATNGWSGFEEVAAVLAIALAATAVAAAVNQELATRLPLGWLAIALGIFALLSIAEIWTSAIAVPSEDLRIGLGSSAYIGLAGVAVASAGAIVARWGEIRWPRSATAAAGMVITLALIASIALPALNASENSVQIGFAPYICVFACLGLVAWHGQRPGPRLATAAAIGTLVAAYLLPYRHATEYWPYELWLLLACAATLLVLALIGGAGLRVRRPSVSELAIVAGSVVLLVSLFLPWQSRCYAGHCSSRRGWSTAGLAGVFTLGLLVALVWRGRIVREFAIGAAIFVLAAGLVTATVSSPGRPPEEIGFVYGSLVGFAGAAVLVAFGLSWFRPNPDTHLLARLVPVSAAGALLFVEVTPNLLTLNDFIDKTNLFARQSPFAPLGLVGAIAILLTLRLLLRWFDRPEDSAEIVLLPLALLALTTFVVIHAAVVTTTDATLGLTLYGKGISWEGWFAILLCLLLVACGWVARNGAYPWARTDGSASTTSLATRP